MVDLDTEFVLVASVHTADQPDPATPVNSLPAHVNLALAGSEQEVEEAVADKGYHKAEALAACEHWNTRTYIPEGEGVQLGGQAGGVAAGDPGQPAASEGSQEQAAAEETK